MKLLGMVGGVEIDEAFESQRQYSGDVHILSRLKFNFTLVNNP
jgi:hypothetical protein